MDADLVQAFVVSPFQLAYTRSEHRDTLMGAISRQLQNVLTWLVLIQPHSVVLLGSLWGLEPRYQKDFGATA